MSDFLRQRLSFPGIAVVLHLAAVLPLACGLNLWLDEAWTMRTTADGIGAAFAGAIADEKQAPLYFVALAAWRDFDESLFWARLFSIVCTVAAIFVFDELLRRFRALNPLFIFLFAVNPFLLYAALEARGYALVILIAAALLLIGQNGYVFKENRRQQFFYVILSVAALYTNYYLGFLLVGNAAALVVLGKWNALKNYLWQMGVVGIFAAPLVLIVREQFGANAEYFRTAPATAFGAKLVWNIVIDLILPTPEINGFAFARLWIIRFAIVVLIIVFGKKIFNRTIFKCGTNFFAANAERFALGAVCAVMLGFFFAAYFLIGADYVETRHAAPLFVPLMLLFFVLVNRFFAARGLIFIAVLLSFFYLVSNFVTYAPLAKRGDWARVAAFIEKNENQGEPIAIFRVYDALPFEFYYRGTNRIIGKNAESGWNAEAEKESADRYAKQIDFIINSLPAENAAFWLVTEDRCDVLETMIECRPLEDFVRANYVVESDKNFYTRRVRLLKRQMN